MWLPVTAALPTHSCALCHAVASTGGPTRHLLLLQAVRVLAFLHGVAEGLSLQPPLKLKAPDRLRLQAYSFNLRMRQATCKAALQEPDMTFLDK